MAPLDPYDHVVQFVRPTVCPDGIIRNFGFYRKRKNGFRQRKPYNIPTAYWSEEFRLLSGYSSSFSWNWNANDSISVVKAKNQARQRFVNKLGDSSSFGATATAEAKETWGLVVSTITRMATAARHVKRGNLFAAASELGLPYKEKVVNKVKYRYEYISRRNGHGSIRVKVKTVVPVIRVDWGTGRSHVKTAASGWLMWSYGVSPLMSDIQNGMDVLTRELPATLVEAHGRSVEEWDYKSYPYSTTRYEAVARVKVQAYVRVNNPNLWLANQLGLINPVQWINEAIPFSFVLDWFSNLSQMISQMTDFAGLEVLDPCTVCVVVGKEELVPLLVTTWPYKKQQTQFTRTLSIPKAKLVFAYERFHWRRGLNAISLLVGFLPGK